MISSLLIINQKGETILHRSYRGDVSRQESQLFCNKVVATKEARDKPIIMINECHYLHTSIGDLTIVAATRANVNAMLVLKFLHRFLDILKAYFGGNVDENAVRKNFVLIYELLDEVLDYGLPQILDVDVLKKYITQGGTKTLDLNDEEQLKKLTVQATGSCSWRAEGVKYRRNEVYIDVIESVNVLISNKGAVLRADVAGQVMVKCQLSGMPECKFGMNDKLLMQKDTRKAQKGGTTIALDDCRFHQCVRLPKFNLERTVTFIPPDGSFELMTYRITENINLPFKILPVIQERGRTRIEMSIKVKANFDKNIFATNLVVQIPTPKSTANVTIQNTSAGKAKHEPTQQCIFWRILKFPGDTEHSFTGEIALAPRIDEKTWHRSPISVSFQVPMFTSSGLRVRFLSVQEKSNYKPVKWIRYVTKAGSYQHRI